MEIVEQILAGNFAGENGYLDFSCTKIELSVSQGENISGSFVIRGESGSIVNGRVISTDYRMECLTPDFNGRESEIAFVFHGDSVEEGESVKGAFRVISSQGEYALPFVITCEAHRLESSMGPVRNLFHFTNLAKSSWQEALDLFYSPDFARVLQGNDARYLAIWQGLSAWQGQEQNMEEFLIHIGKKQAVEFWPEQKQISLEVLPSEGEYQLLEQEITIVRNGWGYTVLNVECDGGFLYTEKTLLSENDFIGNYARLPIYIDKSLLRPGNNNGKIVIYNSFASMEVDVQVKLGTGHILNQVNLTKKKTMVSLMSLYENFRTKRLSLAGWLQETENLVEKLLMVEGDNPAFRLYKAQVLITQERQNEAGWFLDHARDLLENSEEENDELWAYYLYLTTLVTRDEEEVAKVAAEVETMYKRNPDSWRIAWLLLYLSEEYTKMPAVKLQFLERQFERGCTSFVLYIEALQLLNNNPTLLRKLGMFEQQVLYYGIRRDYFGTELAERFLGLLDKNRDYSPVLCRILEKMYTKRRDSRIVQEMCILLTRGSVTSPNASVWYERGVEEQLRITNLYEAYMMSLDPDNTRSIPKAAVLYFAYQNNLDYARTALLCDYVLDNKALFADHYDRYLAKSRDFVEEQIGKERISRHLAGLYARLITPEYITEQNAGKLTRLLFATRIRVEDKRMRKVIIYPEGSRLGLEYPLVDGETIAPIYGNGYSLLFEDAFGNRFAQEIPHELEKFMIPGKYVPELMKYETDCPEFDLWLVREKAEGDTLTPDLVKRAERLCGWEYLEPSLKKQLSLRLMKQYYEMDQAQELEAILEKTEDVELTISERTEVIRYLVLTGSYDRAMEWIRIYGPYFPDANTLSRLIGGVLAGGSEEKDPAVLAAALYLFHRGKHNSAMLEYLGRYVEGSGKELRDIWKELKGNGLNSQALEERILTQLMYTGAYVGEKTAVFESYYQNAGDCDVVRAFLIMSCFEYFVREKLTDGVIFRILMDYFKWGVPIQKVCKLAFLKYYAENSSEVGRDINEALDCFLREMMAEKIHFEFYRNLKGQRHLLGELNDKVIVEYRAKPGSHARIHYVILQEDGEPQEYLSENMRDIYGGVCNREFVLFFGETLQYFIQEEADGEEQLTESGTIQRSEADMEAAGSRYGMINDIVISRNLRDYDTLDSELENYYFREFCGESLFTLK